jgi:diguanylate cyclase (GGDEF)-like protein
VAVPLRSRDTPVGLILLTSARPAAFGDTECEIASALAVQGMTAYNNAVLFAEVQRLATTDSLTGLLNRRQLFALASRDLAQARRRSSPLAAAMIDIDHFKGINDRYGHGVGDQVIRAVADRVRHAVRGTELIGRYGGEEFAVIMPEISTGAHIVGERIRAAIAGSPIETDAGPLPVTASVGIAVCEPADDVPDPDALLARADRALYDAKEAGRNRVVVLSGATGV